MTIGARERLLNSFDSLLIKGFGSLTAALEQVSHGDEPLQDAVIDYRQMTDMVGLHLVQRILHPVPRCAGNDGGIHDLTHREACSVLAVVSHGPIDIDDRDDAEHPVVRITYDGHALLVLIDEARRRHDGFLGSQGQKVAAGQSQYIADGRNVPAIHHFRTVAFLRWAKS